MKSGQKWVRIEEKIRSHLGLRYHLVGVKIFRNGYRNKGEAAKPDKFTAYCNMLRIAAQDGVAFQYGVSDEACPTAKIVLGFQDSKYSDVEPRVKPPETKGILISPLSLLDDEPDVIHTILTPRQMMELTPFIRAGKKELLYFGLKGEAACSEFTAIPYMEHKPNISLLCNGARNVYSDFRDNELILGAPPEVYIKILEEIEKAEKTGGALCGCKVSDVPDVIVEEFEKIGFSKGTDYFFGKVGKFNVRVYFNKDSQGRFSLMTIHLPIKASLTVVDEAKKRFQVLRRPYRVDVRGNLLDLSTTIDIYNSKVNVFDGEEVEGVIKEIVDEVTQALPKIMREDR